MAKLILGQRPKTFTATVKVPMLDGTEGTIACTFKYRTVSEYGAFIDSLRESAGTTDEPAAEFSLARTLEKTRDKNGEYLLKVIEAWNLDVGLDLASAQQLCDELPRAATAIIDRYRDAIVEGRLGN